VLNPSYSLIESSGQYVLLLQLGSRFCLGLWGIKLPSIIGFIEGLLPSYVASFLPSSDVIGALVVIWGFGVFYIGRWWWRRIEVRRASGQYSGLILPTSAIVAVMAGLLVVILWVGGSSPSRSVMAFKINDQLGEIWKPRRWQKFEVENNGDRDRDCRAYLANIIEKGKSESLVKNERLWLYASNKGDTGSDNPIKIKAKQKRKFDLVNATEGKSGLEISSTVFLEHVRNRALVLLPPATYVLTVGISCDVNDPDLITDVTLRYEGSDHIVVIESNRR
jgi:hypothetical protein